MKAFHPLTCVRWSTSLEQQRALRLLLIVVAAAWLAMIAGGCGGKKPVVTPSLTAGPSNTPQPTYTLLPTDLPQPTYTPRPTNTPLPTGTRLPTYTPWATDTPYPSYTPTISPTPGPTPEILWREDFDQVSACIRKEVKGYFTRSASQAGSIADGSYHIRLNGKSNEVYYALCGPVKFPASAKFEVQAHIDRQESPTSFGLVLLDGYINQENAVIVKVNSTGQYAVYRSYNHNTYITVLAGFWAPAPNRVFNNGWNNLKVMTDPATRMMALYLNDQLIAAWRSVYYSSDLMVGLVASPDGKDGNIQVSFDYLQVTR